MKELHAAYHSKRFIQRRRRFYTENDGLISSKINAVSLTEGNKVLLGTERGLMLFDGSAFSQTAQDRLNGRISFTQRITNKTAVGCGNTVYLIDSDGIAGEKNFESKVISVRDQGDHLWILTETELIRTDLRLENISFCRELEGGLGLSLAVNEDNVYVATEDNILVVHGKRMEWKNIQPGFSDMPSDKIHCIAFDRCGYLWVGTENGPAIYDNCVTWLTADKMTLLPKNPVYKIAEDKAGGKYFATDIGVAYLKDAALKYFSAARWVPDNKINDIAVSDDGNLIYVATDKGLSVITAEHTTLAEKAEYFEEMMEKYFIRRGFTATRTFSDNLDNGTVDISDNDGLWTACYVAAESFRYGATGDEDALRKARRGMNALLFLTQITGIPGFTARAVRYPGEEGYGDGDTEWTLSPDGSCEWKGETSSDEMTGHFFGFSVYFDLCADDTEKEKIRNALCAIGDHIIANNYRLVDKDGLPTTWACWNPQLLNYTDKWFAEKGINSLELLAFLKVCYHVSGDEKYNTLRKEFIREHHYPLNVAQGKGRAFVSHRR